jgi:hypothetical protein
MCHVGRGSDEGLTLILRIDELDVYGSELYCKAKALLKKHLFLTQYSLSILLYNLWVTFDIYLYCILRDSNVNWNFLTFTFTFTNYIITIIIRKIYVRKHNSYNLRCIYWRLKHRILLKICEDTWIDIKLRTKPSNWKKRRIIPFDNHDMTFRVLFLFLIPYLVEHLFTNNLVNHTFISVFVPNNKNMILFISS